MAANTPLRSEGPSPFATRGLRSPSMSSDVFSTSGRSIAGSLPTAKPKPAFIAQGAAEHLVSTELDRPVAVTEAALELTNGFLDQTLYNLLLTSRSTSLGALRAAVPKLLRPRLGQAALNAADEEMRDYLEGEDVETLANSHSSITPTTDFDPELAWRLARLRCMVYARLGNMEEEDEDEHLEQERLEEHTQNPQVATATTSALFLTSVIEFLGEQALCTAAQHAERRHNAASPRSRDGLADLQSVNQSTFVLESSDMLQLGREGPLSRLWRSWRRDTRSSEGLSSRPNTPGYMMSPNPGSAPHSRKNSLASPDAVIPEEESKSSSDVALTPSQIPLPMGDRDIDEIEVPGLADDFGSEGGRGQIPVPVRSERRPMSMSIMSGNFPRPPTPTSPTAPERSPLRPNWSRTRSNSLPTPAQSPFTSPWQSRNQDTAVLTSVAGDSHLDDPVSPISPIDRSIDNELTREAPSDAGEVEQRHAAKAAKAGIVGGAVAAIAGALGAVAMASSRKSNEAAAASPQQTEAPASASRSTKTVAEELLGPTNNIAPPLDANTGASITKVSDFDSMHVPEAATREYSPVRHELDATGDASDPEDLALSSTDDENAVRTEGARPRDSGLGVAAPVRDSVAGSASEPATQAVTSSPKRFNREAAVYDESLIPMRDDSALAPQETHPESSNVSRAVTTPQHAHLMGLASQSTDSTEPAAAVGISPWTASTPARNSSLAANVPVRGSSLEQARPTHSPSGSKASQYSHQSQISTTSSRLLGFTRDSDGRPQSVDPQRGSVYEPVSPPRVSHSHHSSLARDQRPGTAGSSSTAKRQHLRLRSGSQDARQEESDESKRKSLEILINSGETLHYTLTPESARDKEFPKSPTKPKTQTQELADFFRNTAPPGEETPPALTSKPNAPGKNGLRSNPPGAARNAQSGHHAMSSPANAGPPSPSAARHRNPLGEPRDARTERNTTRDLADYARSTGPEAQTQLPQSLAARPGTAPGERHGPAMRANEVPVVPVGTASSDTARPATASDKPVNRLKFQARDPRPSRNAEHSELIDFIREGPPRPKGEHRIDRHVAPFRTTMDSDDFNNLSRPHDMNGRSSVGSTHESSVAAKSVQESTNSRTGLLDASNRAATRAMNGVGSAGSGIARQVIPEREGIPPRTRRRVRDPYAIDDSDNEIEEEVRPPPPQPQEETLVDFLRNTGPPLSSTAQPILAALPQVKDTAPLKRKGSSSRLKDILARESPGSSKSGSGSRPSVVAREESPHLTQIGSKRDMYRPTQPTHAAHVERSRQKPRGEGRNSPRTNGTAELAEYLKNSGPPETQAATDAKYMSSPVREQAGFLKFFAKKSSVRK